ncbi:MAG: hypothetical protein M3Z84_07690 [Actinomycetota bacterium]|nr:hypothetical protein [Actinomycetota bacterium]
MARWTTPAPVKSAERPRAQPSDCCWSGGWAFEGIGFTFALRFGWRLWTTDAKMTPWHFPSRCVLIEGGRDQDEALGYATTVYQGMRVLVRTRDRTWLRPAVT